jgi:hypothetical protein
MKDNRAMSNARTNYARAQAYDPDFERALTTEIEQAIFDASRITDANCLALRTGETIGALTSTLAQFIALTPSATRSPTELRRFIDAISRRLRIQVQQVAADPDVRDFHKRIFRGTDVEGTA